MNSDTADVAVDEDEAAAEVSLLSRVLQAMALLGGVAVAVLMVVAVADVALREFTGGGISGALDLTTVVMAGAVYLGMGEAERTGAHVRTPVVTSRLPVRTADRGRLVVHTILVLVLVLAVWFTGLRAIEAMGRGEVTPGAVKVPIWPVRWIIALGLAAMAVEVAGRAWRAFAALRARASREAAPEPTSLDGGL